MTDASAGYYQWLDFNSPMTETTADGLVVQLAADPPATILDVGCGWAELLLRLLAACPDTTGVGIDHNDRLIERAKANAQARNLANRVTFASTLGRPEPADLVINIGAEHVFGTLTQALDRLRSLVHPGGRLLLGTQFWEAPPTEEVAAFIGDLPDLDGLVEATVAAGWRPLSMKTASLEEWDQFESGFLADWERSVVMSPTATEAEAQAAKESADGHRRAYLQRRGVLGFAYLTLGREPQRPTAAEPTG